MWQYRAFRAVQWVVERLPRPWAYALAVFGARVAFLIARTARQRLEDNLRQVLATSDERELRRITWLNFRNHSKAYADLMQLPRARVEFLRPLLKLDGLEHLEAARAVGKGVMVISVHMGSWEIAAAIWSATIAPVALFAEVLEPRELYDWYRTTRARLGISVLPLNRAGLRQVIQALEAQEMVVTAIDHDVLGTGVVLPFFGRPARIPIGPAAIAVRRGTPILPVCVYRLADDSYQAVGLAPVLAEPSRDRNAEARRVTAAVLGKLEAFVRERPDQWHMPHRIWVDQDSPVKAGAAE
jgi:KDO2-lipid IV(A) lauroyltransferase